MAKTRPFDEHSMEYDNWFVEHEDVFRSELEAIRPNLPDHGKDLEIGVGSGRFALPLGIKTGIEPSCRMRTLAEEKGISVLDGVAEDLPFGDSEFDFALMITVICFVDDIERSFSEAYRVLKKGGFLIIGFIDRESPIGKTYELHKNKSIFYRDATFFTVGEVVQLLEKSGFCNFEFTQAIFHELKEGSQREPPKRGFGEGSFVVVKAMK